MMPRTGEEERMELPSAGQCRTVFQSSSHHFIRTVLLPVGRAPDERHMHTVQTGAGHCTLMRTIISHPFWMPPLPLLPCAGITHTGKRVHRLQPAYRYRCYEYYAASNTVLRPAGSALTVESLAVTFWQWPYYPGSPKPPRFSTSLLDQGLCLCIKRLIVKRHP